MGPAKLILNPIAGRGHFPRIEPDLRQLLKAAGVDDDLVHTAGPWHSAELAEQAKGDGMAQEVVSGLMDATEGGEAGIGSSSDSANTAGVPPPYRMPATGWSMADPDWWTWARSVCRAGLPGTSITPWASASTEP
jgi:diacylglycerol kinase family enzyme